MLTIGGRCLKHCGNVTSCTPFIMYDGESQETRKVGQITWKWDDICVNMPL